jgi:hypothetical protein
MKTGLRFNVPEFNDDTYHSDMFYNKSANVVLIRGIPKETTDELPDIVLKTNGDAFGMLYITEDLKATILKYFPDLDLNAMKIIIDDTRFF